MDKRADESMVCLMHAFGIGTGVLMVARESVRPFIPSLRRSKDFDVTSNNS
jgi:hypothetical protein